MGHTTLFQTMMARADADGLPEDHKLRTRAKDFDDAAKGFLGENKTVESRVFLSKWSRARMAWFEYTGEQLI